MDKRQVKIGVYAFLAVLLVSMISLKPYLPIALYHGAAGIYDYQFFSNRTVAAKLPGASWPVSEHLMVDPPAETQKLLSDLDTTALIVLENGKIVYEKYSGDGGVEVLSGSFSMAKSFLAVLYGIALHEGRIQSLDEPVSRYITEWDDRDEGKITIRNLLTMSSGLNWKESHTNPFSITAEAYYGRDLHVTALRQQTVEEPGKYFSFQSGSSQLLGLVLARAVNESLSSYLSKKLWRPLGAQKNALWSLDHEDGMEKAFCCFNATARDFARIGELVRLGGTWNSQSLISEKYIEEMTSPTHLPLHPDAHPIAHSDFGYQWWIYNTPQGRVPFAWGSLGQYLMVIPQKKRVVVRLGKQSKKVNGAYPAEVSALIEWALR